MIELPEGMTLASQLGDAVVGARVRRVLPPAKPHKFCWFNGDAACYDALLCGASVTGAFAFGIFVELLFDNGKRLCFNDGVNVRLIRAADAPANYQLLIEFDDESALVFTVAMYGGIYLHDGEYDNEYYLKSKGFISPFSDGFGEHFKRILAEAKPSLSLKAFIATEQRFPGVGNGVSQDILFEARLNPKRKLASLDEAEREMLLEKLVETLREMTRCGGRDTEKDLFGASGGYKTRMSKNSLSVGCPACAGEITKETYLGGAIYYCPRCQPMK